MHLAADIAMAIGDVSYLERLIGVKFNIEIEDSLGQYPWLRIC